MKWIILIIITALVIVWLMRGRRRNSVEDPQVKTVEQQDYYVTPNDKPVTPDDKEVKEKSSGGDVDKHG